LLFVHTTNKPRLPFHPGMSPPNSNSAILSTLAVFAFFAALVAILTAIALVFPGPFWTPMWNLNPEAFQTFHRLGRIAELLLFVLACASSVTGVGLLRRRRWAWWLAFLGMAANGIGDLLSMVLTHQLVRFGSGVLVAAGFILLLALPPVRRTLS
jgi:hypothetical protein